MQDSSNTKSTAKKAETSKQDKPRTVVMVDQPNIKRQSTEDKLVPGINCYRNKMPGKKPTGKQGQI